MSDDAKSKGSLQRVAILVVILVAVGTVFLLKQSNRLTPEKVQQMMDDRSLIGLSLGEVATRLQHRAPTPPDTTTVVRFPFDHIKGWDAGAVTVDIVDSEVVGVDWAEPK